MTQLQQFTFFCPPALFPSISASGTTSSLLSLPMTTDVWRSQDVTQLRRDTAEMWHGETWNRQDVTQPRRYTTRVLPINNWVQSRVSRGNTKPPLCRLNLFGLAFQKTMSKLLNVIWECDMRMWHDEKGSNLPQESWVFCISTRDRRTWQSSYVPLLPVL